MIPLFLFACAVVSYLLAGYAFSLSKSAIHEALSMIMMINGTLFLCACCLADMIGKVVKALKNLRIEWAEPPAQPAQTRLPYQ